MDNSLESEVKLISSKAIFIENLRKSMGMLTYAIQLTEITRDVFEFWMNTDELFSKTVMEIDEYCGDFVESALFKKIKEGDISAIMFYCKTRLKDRGYHDPE